MPLQLLHRRRVAALVVVLVALLSVSYALADVPTEISYQGRLTDGSPTDALPVDGVLPMHFRIYGSTFGSDLLWDEPWASVTVDNGIFNVMLGSNGSPLPPALFAENDALWLELEVDGELLLPRQRIGSTGFAHRAATATDAQQLDGLGSASWQRRVAASCPTGSSIRAIDADGTVRCEADRVGLTAETDPKIGTIASGGVPRWDGGALSGGNIYDDGLRVDLTVNEVGLGNGQPDAAGITFFQGQTVNPAFGWNPATHRFRFTGSPGTSSPSHLFDAMDGLELRRLDGVDVGRDRVGLWFPLTDPKPTYWFHGVIATDFSGETHVVDNVICWAYNADCGGGAIDPSEHVFKFQLEASYSPVDSSPLTCGPSGTEACSQIEWNVDYVPASGALAGSLWRPLAVHMLEEGNDFDGAISLSWRSFRTPAGRSHFRISKSGRVQINSDGSFAEHQFEVFGESRLRGGDLRIDPDRGLAWTDPAGGPNAPKVRLRAAPATAEDVTLTLPADTGAPGEFLGTDGEGSLSFKAPLSTSSDSHGLLMWSDGTDAAHDTGDEVCAAVGQQCVMAVDMGASEGVPCNLSHGPGGHGDGAHLFQALCK